MESASTLETATSNLEQLRRADPRRARALDGSGGAASDAPRFRCCTCGKEGTKASLSVCGRCRMANYCSPECQRQAWGAHKKECVAHKGATSSRVR